MFARGTGTRLSFVKAGQMQTRRRFSLRGNELVELGGLNLNFHRAGRLRDAGGVIPAPSCQSR
jgi:hypothetical protein